MKHSIFALLIFSFTVSSCGTEKEPRLIENSGYAQGSTYQIKYLTTRNQNFEKEIHSIFEEIDNSMSTYIPTSLISEVNKGGVQVKVDPLFLTVLKRSLEIAKETSGDFDPTVAPIVRLWGFGFDEIRGDVNPEMIEQVKSRTGYERVEIESDNVKVPEGFSLDFNAIAQGFTVDYLADYLESHSISNYMVEVGGEVRTKGLNDKNMLWSIGVDKPQSSIDTEDRFQFILELNNASLATSGNYRKYWVDEATGLKYSHTINPHTGAPARNRLLSASIIAPTAMDADAYATVCMVKGLESCTSFLEAKEEIEGYLVFTNDAGDWEVYITEGFKSFIKN
ncbi:MAG: FAD:protein FMN transferase [Balneolaceae bacterium]